MPVDMTIDERRLRDLARACRSLEDGKEIRKDIVKESRDVLNPVRNEARQSIRAMPSQGHAGMRLRSTVAGKVVVDIKTGGKFPGATLRARKTPKVRKFRNAPKRLNSAAGWNHPAINNPDVSVHQVGKPDWFDGPTQRSKSKYRRAMRKVLEAHEKRIRRKI